MWKKLKKFWEAFKVVSVLFHHCLTKKIFAKRVNQSFDQQITVVNHLFLIILKNKKLFLFFDFFLTELFPGITKKYKLYGIQIYNHCVQLQQLTFKKNFKRTILFYSVNAVINGKPGVDFANSAFVTRFFDQLWKKE